MWRVAKPHATLEKNREEHVGGALPIYKKRQHYILCQSYPQALKCQINSGHYRIAVHNGFYVVYRNYEDC